MAIRRRGRALTAAEGGLALAVVLALACLAPVARAATDVELLQAFRASFTNGETVLSDWTGDSPCTAGYTGVYCSNGTVDNINLYDKGLEGTIPSPDGWQLPDSLERLDLGSNKIRGSIPPGWLLPNSLQFLALSNNSLTGTLSADWQLPPALVSLYLWQNQLEGSFPAGLQLPAALRKLDVSNNLLSGTWPPGTAWPGVMEEIDFYANKLTGTLPEDLGAPDGLLKLRLGDNQIRGALPPASGLPTGLQRLDLDGMSLTGTIPPSWGDLTNLTDILLMGNDLTGTLPSWPGSDTRVFIRPGNEALCGEVPAAPRYYIFDYTGTNQLETNDHKLATVLRPCTPAGNTTHTPASNLTEAEMLQAFRASFTNGEEVLSDWVGDDPCNAGYSQVYCKDGHVSEIKLYDAGLEGEIPSPNGWELPPQLTFLDLGSNKIQGSIPPGWRLPDMLEFLALANNSLAGGLSAQWLSALPPALTTLALYDNPLGGSFPVGVDLSHTRLEILSLGSNQLSGTLPEDVTWPTTLQYLSFGGNSLTGTLSADWLSALPASLNELRLWGNKLGGAFPQGADLTSMRLQIADFTENQLAGSWPTGVTWPSTLQSLSFYNNQMEGTLPQDLGLPEGMLSLRVGSNNLTGPLPALKLPSTLQRLDLDSTSLTGTIPANWPDVSTLKNISILLMNNELSGALPSWPGKSDVRLLVQPGNEGICGEVPSSPGYYTYNYSGTANLDSNTHAPVEGLPPCRNTTSGSTTTTDAQLLLRMRASFTNAENLLPGWKAGTDPCSWDGVTCNSAGNVSEIHVDGRGLEGTIPSPSGWDLPATLTMLWLQNNRITGSIPAGMAIPPQLQMLGLNDNALTGTVPPFTPGPGGLLMVTLFNNSLEGTLPSWSGNVLLGIVAIRPGNPGICGEVPSVPSYVDLNATAAAEFPGLSGASGTGGTPNLSEATGLINQVLQPITSLPDCSPGGGGAGANATDAELLLAFKASFTNGEAVLSNWVAGTNPCDDDWAGITCNSAGLVTKINLQDRSLVGSIPSGGWQLPQQLEVLSLDSNSGLSGTAINLVVLPASLQTLSIYNCSLTGSLPSGWSLPPSLERLNLGLNGLTGSIPSDLRLPNGLQQLHLGRNSLTGTFMPQGLVWPSDMQEVRLYGNELTGTLSAWALPDSLTTLALWENKINGSIPDTFKLPQNLVVLDLGRNEISGSIPPGWLHSLPASLNELHFNENKINGSLPGEAWAPPAGLEVLTVFGNSLEGSLPTWPNNTETHVYIQPGNIGICGEVPAAPAYYSFQDWGNGNNIEADPVTSLVSCTALGSPSPAPAPSTGLDVTLSVTGSTLDNFNANLALQFEAALAAAAGVPAVWVQVKSAANSVAGAAATTTRRLQQDAAALDIASWVASPDPPSTQATLTEAANNGTLAAQLQPLGLTLVPGSLAFGALSPSPSPPMPSPSPGPSPEPSSGGSSSMGIVIGAVIGVVVALGGAGLLWWFCWVRPRRRRTAQEAAKAAEGAAVEQEAGNGSAPAFENGLDSASSLPSPRGAYYSAPSPRGPEPTSSALTSSGGMGKPWDTPKLRPSTAFLTGSGGTGSGVSQQSAGRQSVGSGSAAAVDMWALSADELDFIKMIGEGSFGKVYVAKWRETLVAVKVLMGVEAGEADSQLSPLTLSHPMLLNLRKESSLMASLRHPNVVSFLGVCTTPPCLVSEFCEHGSLTDVYLRARNNPDLAAVLTWRRRLQMLVDACKGMVYLHLHQPPIIHRDLKSPNLLADENWVVKVADFNLSKLMDTAGGADSSSVAATNPRWLAPEILDGEGSFSLKSDVFAMGVIMWELLSWELPWRMSTPWQIVRAVTNDQRPPMAEVEALPGALGVPADQLSAYVSLMQQCWAQDPEARPSFVEVITQLRLQLQMATTATGAEIGSLLLHQTPLV